MGVNIAFPVDSNDRRFRGFIVSLRGCVRAYVPACVRACVRVFVMAREEDRQTDRQNRQTETESQCSTALLIIQVHFAS